MVAIEPFLFINCRRLLPQQLTTPGPLRRHPSHKIETFNVSINGNKQQTSSFCPWCILALSLVPISISTLFPQLKLTSFHVSFPSRVKMNSVNRSAPNIWVFIAQLVEHCNANADAIGSNPVEAQEIFCQLKFEIA